MTSKGENFFSHGSRWQHTEKVVACDEQCFPPIKPQIEQKLRFSICTHGNKPLYTLTYYISFQLSWHTKNCENLSTNPERIFRNFRRKRVELTVQNRPQLSRKLVFLRVETSQEVYALYCAFTRTSLVYSSETLNEETFTPM